MAKKAAQLRVHQLAKDIGVTSKDIIAKCEAEEIPGITNHMSAVSMGLAATIREWFGGEEGGGVTTAVEKAAPVDLKKAKARAKKATRKAKPVRGAPAPDESPEPAENQVITLPPLEMPAPAESEAEFEFEPGAPVPAEAQPLEEAPGIAASTEDGIATDPGTVQVGDEERPVMNVPDRPEVIKPIGPMLQQPSKTKLAGPKVIRVEAPEVIQPRAPRTPRTGGGPRSGRGAGVVPDMPEVAGAPIRSRGGAPGAGGGGGASRRNKRRSTTARTEEGGRTAKATPAEGGNDRNWRAQDVLERERRLSRSAGFFKAHRRDSQRRTTGGVGQRASTPAEGGGMARVAEPITVKELSAATGVKAAEIVKKMFLKGTPVTVNSTIPTEAAVELMVEYDIELEVVEQKTASKQIAEQFESREMVDERPRSPVITILGHVDHGKTSLLDAIRKTEVAAGEAGGITQATSAFQVPVHVGDGERKITFIDTPGHEAFTEMRARGAKVTDIVVLVVAADDGVMPQTVESINHAKAADVPIIVALNKVDKPEATDGNIQRILGELAERELNPTEWGGSTEVVRTSAVKGEGLQDLLEVLDYQAQLLELTADYGGRAEGTVIEAQLEEGRGAVANLLVQQGKLKKSDYVVVGRSYGRVRDILDDHGRKLEEAWPSTPIAVSGLNEVPDAGDKFYVVKNAREAESAAGERRREDRERDLATERVTLDTIYAKLAEAGKKELPLIVKADVQGSVETLRATLERISNDEITIGIKHSAVGGINDSDILLAETTGAIILGFNVTTTSAARRQAEAKGVDIRLYEVIYDLTDDVKKAAEGLLEPEYKLEVLGHAEVREVFRISKVGMVAGCYVTDGAIERQAQIRVTRDGIVVESDRRLEQLKRFKDDAKEVRAGQECGMRIEGYNDVKAGDVIECYKSIEVRRTL